VRFDSAPRFNGRMVRSVINQTQLIMEAKQFPNGFASWMETHYEVTSAITKQLLKDGSEQSAVVRERYRTQGTGGMYELAEELTDAFEWANQGRVWDGDYFDTIDAFTALSLKT